MKIPSYDDLTPSIPDVSANDVFASVERLLPDSGPVASSVACRSDPPAGQLFACLRSARMPDALMEIARDFSPRIQRYGPGCVVLDVAGLGRLLGPPDAIGIELARAAAEKCGSRFDVPDDSADHSTTPDAGHARPRFTSRYGIRIEAHPAEHAALNVPSSPGGRFAPPSAFAIAIAPTQVAALLLSLGGASLIVVTHGVCDALAPGPLHGLRQLMAAIHGVTMLRAKGNASKASTDEPGWPAWTACEHTFDVLQRWGLKTLGEFAALPAADLSARLGNAGVALQQIARGVDPHPLVPDPDVPRFVQRMELEWPIDGLEPLSFVVARLLDPLSAALERADRAAAAIRLDLRLVDRSSHTRMLQLPAAIRDAKVLRTLLLLDLESHPPSAEIDVVTIEIDPAPGRVLQYSLLERAMPSAETLATLTARLGALVGDSRCGTPELLDSYRPDAFAMQRFAPAVQPRPSRVESAGAQANAGAVPLCLRRFRPPVAVRVTLERGRPAHVAIDRRGMSGGHVVEAAGPWRTSGEWWAGASRHWDRDEWDVSFSDGSSCRLFQDRESGRWFVEGGLD